MGSFRSQASETARAHGGRPEGRVSLERGVWTPGVTGRAAMEPKKERTLLEPTHAAEPSAGGVHWGLVSQALLPQCWLTFRTPLLPSASQ